MFIVTIVPSNDDVETVMNCMTLHEAYELMNSLFDEREYNRLYVSIIEKPGEKQIADQILFPLNEQEKGWLRKHDYLDETDAIILLRESCDLGNGNFDRTNLSIKLEFLSPKKYRVLLRMLRDSSEA